MPVGFWFTSCPGGIGQPFYHLNKFLEFRQQTCHHCFKFFSASSEEDDKSDACSGRSGFTVTSVATMTETVSYGKERELKNGKFS